MATCPRRPGQFRKVTAKKSLVKKPVRETSDLLKRIDEHLADRPDGFWPVVLIAYDPAAKRDPVVVLAGELPFGGRRSCVASQGDGKGGPRRATKMMQA